MDGAGLLTHPVVGAVSAVRAALAAVAEAPLWGLSDGEVGEVVAQATAAIAALEALRLRAVAEAERRDLAAQLSAASTAGWLRHTTRMHPAAAARMVRLAGALEQRLPATAAALGAGSVSVAHAEVIATAVDRLPADVPGLRADAEDLLVDAARLLDPKSLAAFGREIWHRLDPDAADEALGKALEKEAARARPAQLSWHDDDHGTTWFSGHAPTGEFAALRAALDALSAPLPATPEGPDPRTAAQRRGDALIELGRRALREADLPDTGGEPPTVVVTIPLAHLQQQVGAATLDDGTLLGPTAFRRVACDAKIIPVVLGGAGQILDLGRAARLFTGPLRRAIMLRDRGCAHPHCDRPARWCECHHITHWADGGGTDLGNGLLLCGFHHADIHTGHWQVLIHPRDGLPVFIPPKWIDPEQKPLRNPRHPPPPD